MADAGLADSRTEPRMTLKTFAELVDRFVGRAIDVVCMTLLFALFVLILWIVVGRLMQFGSPAWSDEIVELFLSWLIFLGAAGLWRRGEQFRVDLLDQTLPEGMPRRAITLLVEILSLLFLAILTWYGMRFALRINDTSPTFAWPRFYWFIVMPLSSGIMVAYSLVRIVRLVAGNKPQ